MTPGRAASGEVDIMSPCRDLLSLLAGRLCSESGDMNDTDDTNDKVF